MLDKLQQIIGKGKIRQNVSLGVYSTFKLGGKAEYLVQAETEEDIINSVQAAHTFKLNITILGGISNVIIGEGGIKGIVIRNLTSDKKIIQDEKDFVLLEVSSGYYITRLAKETAEFGYEGIEFHYGLPGTIGGAVYMNSKWSGHQPTKYVGDAVYSIRTIDREEKQNTRDKAYLKFAYDYSFIQETKEIILNVTLKLKKNVPKQLTERCMQAMDYRRRTQPYGVATSGCFFKNVNGQSVGKMIDDLGLKGYSIGGAEISTIHANFIVNKQNATPEDVRKLVDYIKKKIKKAYNVDIEEEVIFL